MIDIKQIKISLMEKTGEVKEVSGKKPKSDYIIKSSATLKYNEYIDLNFPDADDEDRHDILMQASNLMYQDLLDKNKNGGFDSVGIWVTMGEEVYENSMLISALDEIKQYGDKDIVPIFELIKMTIPINE